MLADRPAARGIVILVLSLLLVLGLVRAAEVLERRAIGARAGWPAEDARLVVPPPRVARLLSAGHTELAADLMWARTLVYFGEGAGLGVALADIDPLLETVNGLDPRFRRPYVFGAYAAAYHGRTPTERDFRASVAVLERGLRVFPRDWELAWLAGIRYAYDLRSDDPDEQRRLRERGAELLERAMRMPDAPPGLPLEATALRSKLGQRDRALRELREMILYTPAGNARRRLEKQYAALASVEARDEIAAAAEAFQARWRATIPYAPPTIFVLLGERPPSFIDLEALTRPPTLDEDGPEGPPDP